MPAASPAQQTAPMPPLPPAPAAAPPAAAPPIAIFPPISGSAVAAFVLALLGLIGPAPVIGEVLALIFVGRAWRQIEAARGGMGGWEMARAARILAWVALVLHLIVIGLAAWLILEAGTTFDLGTLRD